MKDYFVVTPCEVMDEEEFMARKEELAKRGAKVMAVVFNCEDTHDFERKYFGKQISA